MDLFQRAVNLFDRAQDRMVSATNQAARAVVTAAQVRALEARQAELRQQIEQRTLDLGRLTFQRWKNHGVGNDAALAGLCSQIDTLNTEYQQVVTDLADARAALGDSTPYPAPSPGAMTMSSRPYAPPPPAPLPPQVPANPYLTVSLPPPVRPPRPARECPECYSLVPGTTDFCPSCGMRVAG